MSDCVFCRIIEGHDPADVVATSDAALTFVPLNPVTRGHVLVVPRKHARYIWQLPPLILASVMVDVQTAARAIACNIIQSNGVTATQTVPHVHFHVVPRRGGDGLALPWTGQTEKPVGAPPGGPSD